MTAEKRKKTPGPKITWKEIKKQKFLLICSAFFVIYGLNVLWLIGVIIRAVFRCQCSDWKSR